MKILDVINQIRLVLPKYTDLFTSTCTITNSVVTSGSCTLTTSTNHNLSTGDSVTIEGATTLTPIVSASQSGLVFTFTTSIDHDLTENWHETVTLGGFSDSAWNDTFTLNSVPNRRTFTISSANSLPSISAGEYLKENRIDGINGYHSATKLTTRKFSISGDFLAGNYDAGTVHLNPRIIGAVNFERALEQYTQYNTGEYFLFVVPNDVEASKDRNALSDATAQMTGSCDIRMRMITGFTVFVFANASSDMMALETIDTCRYTLYRPILKTLHGAVFDTGLSDDTGFKTINIGHGEAYYDKSIYVHSFQFETQADVIQEDSCEEVDTRAYRDIDYTLEWSPSGSANTLIDLDEDSLNA